MSFQSRALALAATLLWPTWSLAADPEALAVVLRNDGQRDLRCVMVKAHFMSETLASIRVGERLELVLQRDPTNGSLFVRSDDGRRQMIENVLCGADDDWSRTRGEVPLLPLRASSSASIELSCLIEHRLQCAVANPDD